MPPKLTSWRAVALAATLAGSLMGAGATPALARGEAAPNTPGAVVTVSGAPFLWVADDLGLLHLVGDTRALDGHTVEWSNVNPLTLDQIRAAGRGEPWLSAALVRIGDAIYLPRWTANAATPTLYHVQSPMDLALIGVNDQNYGQLVRDKAAWDQQYGLASDSLPRAELPAIVPAAPPPPPPPPPPAPAAPPPVPTVAPPPAAAPASAPPTPAPTTAAQAYAASGTLTHVPQFGAGGDVNFDLPPGRGWSDAMSVTALADLIPQGALQGEQTIAQWRALNTQGGPYTYLQVKAIDLATHPDVTTAQNLADLKMRFVCRDVSSCATTTGGDMTIGVAPGVPATPVDSAAVRKFGDQKQIGGVTQDVADKSVDELMWRTRDVFFVKGNYGYDVRLASTDTLSTERLADLDRALSTLLFRY
jgi:hypothetical protein